MNTNSSNIPAGIFKGLEIFAMNGVIYVLYQGKVCRFEEAPECERYPFMDAYIEDKQGQKFIRREFGLTDSDPMFRQWLFCKFGGLDGEPDSVNGRIHADVYNSACDRVDCIGRGRFCGVKSGLRCYEVVTLRYLANGVPEKCVAVRLNVSYPTVKSRVERLKERFAVLNIAALIAKVTALGVTKDIENMV